MKTFSRTAFILSIILMVCAGQNQVWGQNRAADRNSQSTNTSSTSRTSRSSSSDNKSSSVSRRSSQISNKSNNNQATHSSQPSSGRNNNSQVSRNNGSSPIIKNNTSAVRDRRTNSTASPANRPNSTPARTSSPSSRANNKMNRDKNITAKPNAVQYHNPRPEPRKSWERPYISPSHKPVPAYHYGIHHFGYRSRHIPPKAVMHVHNNIHYYFCDGIYYRPYYGDGYVICRPPFGTRFAATLFNTALTVALINELHDTAQRAEQAALVAAQYARINTTYSPRTYTDISKTVSNNNVPYYQDGVFYILENNQYTVIEPPIGALVTELPNDYEEIEIDGTTYYKVEDTLYKVTVIEGALYFEVICTL